MSSWLCYTRKMLASAISSIAEELEQTALDLNEAVHTMGMTREAAMEQKLYSNFNSQIACDAELDNPNPSATTQQPLTSSVLPVNIVPGDLVLGDHFSPPTHHNIPRDPSDQEALHDRLKECPDSPENCGTAVSKPCLNVTSSLNNDESNNTTSVSARQKIKLGDKRPGKVIRTSDSDSCILDWDTNEDGVCEDGDDEAFCIDEEKSEKRDVENRLGLPECENQQEAKTRWLLQFSRAMNLAYNQVTNAVVTLIEDASMLSDVNTSDGQPAQSPPRALHIKLTPTREECSAPEDKQDLQYSPKLTLDILESPMSWEELRASENHCLVSPASAMSTYSTDSFEVIEPSMLESYSELKPSLTEMDGQIVIEASTPISNAATSKQNSDTQKMSQDMSTSSAEFVNFNFSNLISGRYFRAISPTSHAHLKVEKSNKDDSHLKLPETDAADDDDGSSFDVMSDNGEEEYLVL